jgi:hypothetical protein
MHKLYNCAYVGVTRLLIYHNARNEQYTSSNVLFLPQFSQGIPSDLSRSMSHHCTSSNSSTGSNQLSGSWTSDELVPQSDLFLTCDTHRRQEYLQRRLSLGFLRGIIIPVSIHDLLKLINIFWNPSTLITEILQKYHAFYRVTLKYRVIHKSLRNFRTPLRNNQDRHSRKEHINK